MKYTQESIKEFEDNLSLLGYKKYKENYQSGDYIYWKSFDRQINEDGEKLGGYMVGFKSIGPTSSSLNTIHRRLRIFFTILFYIWGNLVHY